MAEGAHVVVVDDHPLLGQMLVDRLSAQRIAATVVDVDDPGLADTIRGLAPDLVLLDAVFHDDEHGGMRLLGALHASDVRVAITTNETRAPIIQAIAIIGPLGCIKLACTENVRNGGKAGRGARGKVAQPRPPRQSPPRPSVTPAASESGAG